MKKKLLLFASLFVFHLHCVAQKEAQNWYFGARAGFDFGDGEARPVSDGAMVTKGASAVISDKSTGELLFYTNGRNIWNRQHQRMPNGQDFPDDCPNTVSQAALIVPVPGSEHRYYVFSIFRYYSDDKGETVYHDCSPGHPPAAYSCEVRYAVVDMRLDGGLGDVVAARKNIVLQRNATEKLTAIPHANGKDFWLLTHEADSDAFYVYLLSAAGISTPVVQRIGSAHRKISGGAFTSEELWGMLKASPDGRKLACAVTDSDITPGAPRRPFDLFDFDPATGRLSNYMALDNPGWKYGVSFSPDNTKLYVSGCNFNTEANYDIIWQYDLGAGDARAVRESGMSIVIGNPITNITRESLFGYNIGAMDLQLAPDGRLYASKSPGYGAEGQPDFGKVFLVIGKPNEKGFACEINYELFDFGDGAVAAIGLPNFIQSYFNEPAGEAPADCDPEALRVYPNPTSGSVRLGLEGDCHQGQPFTLRVFNALGQQVAGERHGLQLPSQADLSALAPGLYLLVFTFPDRQVVERVIKL